MLDCNDHRGPELGHRRGGLRFGVGQAARGQRHDTVVAFQGLVEWVATGEPGLAAERRQRIVERNSAGRAVGLERAGYREPRPDQHPLSVVEQPLRRAQIITRSQRRAGELHLPQVARDQQRFYGATECEFVHQ